MVYVIGHRGAAGHAPENTLKSFHKAVELGADMVELDIHLCATGEPVVIHDDTVDRTTDGSGRVQDLSLDDLSGSTQAMARGCPPSRRSSTRCRAEPR